MRFLMRFLLGLALQSSPAVSGGSQNHILLAELGITVSQQLSWRLQRAVCPHSSGWCSSPAGAGWHIGQGRCLEAGWRLCLWRKDLKE